MMKLTMVINIVFYRVTEPHKWAISLSCWSHWQVSTQFNCQELEVSWTKESGCLHWKVYKGKTTCPLHEAYLIVWLWRLLDSWSLQWRRYWYSTKLRNRYAVLNILNTVNIISWSFLGVLILNSLIHIFLRPVPLHYCNHTVCELNLPRLE